ncbi:hypothetical protein LAZ67_10002869 [Cordylochernes scorpioides]|uniref:Major facilitator superfamily (MFS) profile domain-containing protein n=1 Tax=Cordylochernes scorpioides TaxID=51811 RepID=A0ABY6KZ68_9ARAC|nr:hypothetical protein LAZ67_10002869 [Cordylochernes scorpioides]
MNSVATGHSSDLETVGVCAAWSIGASSMLPFCGSKTAVDDGRVSGGSRGSVAGSSVGPRGPLTEEEEDEIPEPPNGGWGWVVVAASFFCNTVVDGVAYTFGIFLMELVEYYGATRGETAWVGSLLSGTYMSVGPLVSALTNAFGCRAVTMAGSLVSCLAFFLSTWAPNVRVLMITYGVMGGFGFGLVYLPAIVSVSYYFSTKRAFATGIAVCGSGMGAFVFAPLCQKLLEVYDWKGALTILAGISLNAAIFGALMRPLKGPNSSKKEPSNTEPGVQSTLNMPDVGKSSFHVLTPLCESPNGNETKVELKHLPSLEATLPPTPRIEPIVPMRASRRRTVGPVIGSRKLSMVEYPTQTLQTPPQPKLSVSIGLIAATEGWQGPRRQSLMDRKDLYRPMYRKDIFYSGSITHLKEFHKSNNDVRTYLASMTSIPTLQSIASVHEEETKIPCLPRNMRDTLSQMLDFTLLGDYSFLLLGFVNILGFMGYYIPFVYVTGSAVSQGVPKNQAVYLISAIGITNIAGRLIFGWLADRPGVSALYVNNLCLITSGLAVLAMPYCTNFSLALAACCCFGVFICKYLTSTTATHFKSLFAI